jgi:beta-glucosidase
MMVGTWFSRAVTGVALLAAALSVPALHGKSPGDSVRWPHVAPAGDPAIEARVEALLARMTIEAKVGQIIQADINRVTPDDVKQYRLGSVLNGANSGPDENDKAPAAEWLKLADRFYAASMDVPRGEPAIPVMWGTDAVHGHGNIVGATLFPHNIGLGAANDPDLIRRIGEATAQEIVVTGQDWDFSPTIAVVRDDRWGRVYEGYSEDPQIVAAYGRAMVEGLQGKLGTAGFLGPGRVIATAKHFLGDGGTRDGRNEGDNLADDQTLRDIHGAGYLTAIAAGAQSVMASHNAVRGMRMHGHRQLLTDVLRGQIGFDGLVVGDWNGHRAVPGCTTTNCAAAFNAGLDMFMAPDSWRDLYRNTLAQVRSGEIPVARLDEAVRRVLRVKLRAGLFEKGRPSARPLAGQFALLGSAAHRAIAREAVRKSLVLLKNEGGLLPLRRTARILVAGDAADNISKQSGGWSINWQGTGLTNADFPHAQSIYSGIREAVAGSGSAELSVDGRFATRPDVAIVIFGEEPYAESQGDVETLEYRGSDKKDLELLRRLKAAGIPTVSIFLSGRPLWVNPEINASNAFVAAFLPGGEGGGVADLLFRTTDGRVAHDFTGRLSFSWPKRADQYALNRGDRAYDPLFAYGYGLSYARPRAVGRLSEARPPLDPARLPVIFDGTGFGGPVGLIEGGQRVALSGNTGRSASGRLSVAAVDRRGQEDSRSLVWNGSGSAKFAVSLPRPRDLALPEMRQLSLIVDYRLDSGPSGDVVLAMECGENCAGRVSIARAISAAPPGQWRTLSVPLRCFVEAGLDPRRVSVLFAIETSGRLGLSIAGLRLGIDPAHTRCPA